MRNNRRALESFTSIPLVLALAVPLSCYRYALAAENERAPGQKAAPAAATATPRDVPSITDIHVSYKLDPRIASGVYGGERWVSPPTYTGASAQDTVEARALGIDAKGTSIPISPQWVPSDPAMVMVSPSEGGQVKITVRRAGQSSLHVISAGVSKELAIKAVSQNNAMHLEIAQLAAKQTVDGAGAPGTPALKSESAEPAVAQGSSPLKTPKEKLSYALGANLGKGIRRQSVEVDSTLVAQGLKDALADSEPLLSEHEVAIIVTGLQKELRSKQIAAAAEKIVANKELAEKNKREEEAFLAGNKNKEGVVELASGLQYKILKAGDGQKPAADDQVVCHYRGTLVDGTEFDSSYKRNEPVTFPLSRVIKGWNEALQLMPAGSKWQLFVPSKLAYGERGANSGIGPNATLIFEVELVSIQGKSSGRNAAAVRPPAARRHARAMPSQSR